MRFIRHHAYSLYNYQWRWYWQRGSAVLLALFTAVVLILAGCLQEPDRPLRVGIPAWVGFADLYLAEKLNYYQEQSIRLLDYPSGALMFQAFQNGELEALCSTLTEALRIAEVDSEAHVVLILDSSNGADALLSKPEIQTIKELAGRRVGVGVSAFGSYMLSRSLEQAQLSLKDVKIVPLEVTEQEAAYQAGKVDAVVTYDPTRLRLLALNAKQLFDSSQIPNEIVDVLVVHKDLLKQQKAAMRTLVKGWFQAKQYAQQHPQVAAQQVAALQDLSPEQYLETLKGIRFPSLEENQQLLSKTDPTLLSGVKRLATVMQQQNLLKQSIDPEPVLDDEFVEKLSL